MRHRCCCCAPRSDWNRSIRATARDSYLDAITAAVFASQPTSKGSAREIATARAVRAAVLQKGQRAVDDLLDGLALMITEGPAAGTPFVQQAVNAFRDR